MKKKLVLTNRRDRDKNNDILMYLQHLLMQITTIVGLL